MLQWLRERLSSTSVHKNEEVITDNDRIQGLLANCARLGKVFTVRINQSRGTYESRVLENGEHLLLEELSPIDGHTKIKPGTTLCLEADTDDEWIRFETQVTDIRDHGNVQAYESAIPQALHWDKRRDSPRLQVSADEAMSVDVTDSRSMDAGLYDLSLSGIGLKVDSPQEFKEGEVLEGVAINLPNGQRIEGDVEVRHSLPDEQQGQRIGGRFIADDQRALNNVLNWLAETDGQMTQRRAEPRTHLDAGESVEVKLAPGAATSTARLVNISTRGLGLSFDQKIDIAVGDTLPAITLRSANGIELHGNLSVRFVDHSHGQTRIGGAFKVTSEDQADLSSIITWLEDD